MRLGLILSDSSKKLELIVHNHRLNFAFGPTTSLYSKMNSEQSRFSDDDVKYSLRSMDTLG